MTKIQHGTMGTVNTPNNVQNQPQHYVVDDPTMNMGQNNSQQQFVQMHQGNVPSIESLQAQKRIVEQQEVKKSSSKLLENLIFLGRAEREIEISGTRFTVSTLTNKENTDIMKELYALGENAADLYMIRTLTLAQGLKKINDTKIEDIELDESFSNNLKKKVFIIESLQSSVLNKLMETFDLLVEEGNKAVSGEEIKK